MSEHFSRRPWRELESIPMPTGVSLLKKDDRGFPIPYFAAYIDGKPDFRVIDPDHHRRCIDYKLCGICGYHFGGKPAAFVGGPKSIESHLFLDAPLHEECATYALRVCPYLAAPTFRTHHVYIDGAVELKPPGQQRPDTFFMGISDRFRPIETPKHIVVQAGEWMRTEKWKQGTRIL